MPARLLVLVLAACAAVLFAGGCSHAEIVEEGSVPTPPIWLEDAGDRHLLVMRAPHPGWGLEFDRAQRTAGPTRLLITVRRPDPALLFPQQVVDKRVTTTVRTEEAAEIFGRVLDHNADGEDVPYRRVLTGNDGA